MSLSGERGSVGDSYRSVMTNCVPSMRVTSAFSDFGPDSSTILTDLAVCTCVYIIYCCALMDGMVG